MAAGRDDGPRARPVQRLSPPAQDLARKPILQTVLAVGLGIALAVGLTAYLAVSALHPCAISPPRSSVPVVGLASPIVGPSTVTFQVACSTLAVSIDNYGYRMSRGQEPAMMAYTLRAGNQTETVGNDTFYVFFSDVDGYGTLNAFDSFRIGMVDGSPLPGGAYAFNLVWLASGSWYTAVTWQI